ncbi:MAG: HIT domain-containing protein [Patescibacteria group bacterium]
MSRSKSNVKDCPHCDLQSFALEHPLFTTENFLVVCDVHPLVEGHLLIIPRKHISCVGEYSEAMFLEFKDLYSQFSYFVKDAYGAVSSFEHGIAGQTVFHAHTHILPYAGDLLSIIPEGKEKTRAIKDISELRDIYRNEGEYLFFSIDNNYWLVDTNLAVPRFFRGRFARALGVPERGNWKEVRQNKQLMARISAEITNLEEKWQRTAWIPMRNGKKLESLLQKPDGNGPFPVVLFVPGLGMTLHEWNSSFDEIAERLVNNGFLTIQFQFPIFDRSGHCRELPLDERAMILKEVIKWVARQSTVNPQRIGILAQSYGVATVMSLTSLSVKTLCLVSGSYNPKESIAKVYQERGVKINYQGDTTLPRSSGEFTTVGKEFWQAARNFDGVLAAKKIHAPVLFIHGDRDTKIPVSEVEKVFVAVPSTNKKLKVFKGGDHGITDVPRPMREEFLQDVVEWFKQTL